MGPLATALLKLRPALAAAATVALNQWQPDPDGMDDMLGGGGCCDDIAQALAGVITQHLDCEVADGGQDGDDHAWLIVRSGPEVLGVDVPPQTYEEGGGYSWTKIADIIAPTDIHIFETWWPEGKMHPIYKLIADGTATVDDFNELLTEASIKSVKERVRRLGNPVDANRMHDSAGHSRVAIHDPAAPTGGDQSGGIRNDPRKTARGRMMLKRQAAKAGVHESKENNKRSDACDLIKKHVRNRHDLCSVWWNEKEGKIRVSNGDWAEYDTRALNTELEELLGKDRVEMGAEIGNPDGEDWTKLDLESVYGEAIIKEYPTATFRSKAIYDPICPHCGEIMHERHYVPDPDTMKVRVEKIHGLPKEDLGKLMDGQLEMDLGPYLFRHRGPCYDKGPFQIEWPSQAFSESRAKLIQSLLQEDTDSYEAESKLILQNKKAAGSKPHKFVAATHTAKNGHPRCKFCGDEPTENGQCAGVK